MKKHLNWPEDNRICNMPDGIESCPGCCLELSPIPRHNVKWECIWKRGHSNPHSDYWCCEWDENGIIKRTEEIRIRLLELGLNTKEINMWLVRPVSESLAFVMDDQAPQEIIDDGCSFLVLSYLYGLASLK